MRLETKKFTVIVVIVIGLFFISFLLICFHWFFLFVGVYCVNFQFFSFDFAVYLLKNILVFFVHDTRLDNKTIGIYFVLFFLLSKYICKYVL